MDRATGESLSLRSTFSMLSAMPTDPLRRPRYPLTKTAEEYALEAASIASALPDLAGSDPHANDRAIQQLGLAVVSLAQAVAVLARKQHL